MNKKHSLVFATSVLLIALCGYVPDSPFDENSPAFVPSTATIDFAASSLKPNDTIHFDSATIVLSGNRSESRFRVKVDNLQWSSWAPAGVFPFTSLSNGKHTVYISTKYMGGNMTTDDSVVFFVKVGGSRPSFPSAMDSVISVDTGAVINFFVVASGAAPLNYQWFKGSSSREVKTDSNFTISTFTINDTGTYFCIASNSLGNDTSRTFILKIRSGKGCIKGAILSIKDSAKLSGIIVTINPGMVVKKSDAMGYFEFTNLAGGIYSITISQIGYEYFSIDTITVKDSMVKDLGFILLRKTDTGMSTFIVTYNGNGNTGGNAAIDSNKYETGDSVEVLGNTGNLIKIGYTFTGWNTKADGSGENYIAGFNYVMSRTSVTFYAKWANNPTFLVIYHSNGANGGCVPMDVAYEVGAAVKVSDNTGTLTKIGFAFCGWNTLANGAGTTYAPGATFTKSAMNDTLFAKWNIGSYTVKFDNQFSGAVDSTKVNFGEKITPPSTTPTRAGYTFGGWYKEVTCANAWNFGAGEVLGDMTLFAKWTAIICVVKFASHGVTVDSIRVNFGDKINPPSPNPTRVGYIFAGWYKDAGCTNEWNFMNETVVADITLYAKWTVKTYTVKFSSQGGLSVDSQRVDYGQKAAIPPDPTWAGHGFSGWYKEAGCINVWNFNDATVSGDVTLYAKWTINSYRVTFDCQGGSPTPPQQSVEYDSYATQPTRPTLVGFTFGGWYKESGCTNAWTFATNKVTGEVTLFAKWTIIKFTVTFHSQGGSPTPTVQSVNYGGYATEPTGLGVPILTSYVLDGWYTESSLINKWSFGTQVFGNCDLYAKWVIRDADGNIYTETTIGGKVWMVGNLKTTKYNDNTPISEVTNQATWDNQTNTPAFCWYSNDQSNKNPYGALYNWDAVNTGKIAPKGWHVATKDEWASLLQTNHCELKESGESHWNDSYCHNNKSGFTAVAAGARNTSFYDLKGCAYFWTSTSEGSQFSDMVFISSSMASSTVTGTGNGCSIRCVKD